MNKGDGVCFSMELPVAQEGPVAKKGGEVDGER